MAPISELLTSSRQAIQRAADQIDDALGQPDPEDGFQHLRDEFLRYLDEQGAEGTPRLRRAIDALGRISDPITRYQKLLEVAGAFVVAVDRELIH